MAVFQSSLKIDGLQGLTKKLSGVTAEVREKAGRSATGRMAAMVRDEAKANVHTAAGPYRVYNRRSPTWVEPGHVARNIIMKRLPASERGSLTSAHIVTVSMSQDGPYGARNIAVMIEYGINMDTPRPFMRPAFDGKKSQAVSAAKNILSKAVEEAWKQR